MMAPAAIGILACGGVTLAMAAVGATINPKALPLGDGQYSTTAAQRGSIYLCNARVGGGGAQVNGPWINSSAGTWDSTQKATVDGAVKWPAAYVSIKVRGGQRIVKSNDLPTNLTTGTFPIQSTDDAYAYDHNPAGISAHTKYFALPAKPQKGAPQCIGGEVGMATNGVEILNGLDALLRDAAAHELQDHCDGHPNNITGYHYHLIPSCLYKSQSKHRQSGLVGYAFDGFPIYGPRGPKGRMLDNDDLDVCHGRTSRVWLDGRWQKTYHYVATLEYPYTVGCFRGTVIAEGVPR